MSGEPLQDEALVEWILGTATEADAERIRAAVESDPAASAKAKAIRRALAGLHEFRRSAAEFKVTGEQLTHLSRLMKPGAVERLGAALRKAQESIARIVFDSLLQPSVAPGYRGSREGERVIRAESAAGGVDLHIEPRAGGREWHVAGEVRWASAGGGGAPTVVRAMRASDGKEIEAGADEGGFFELALQAGAYEVLIETDKSSLVIERVEIPGGDAPATGGARV